MNFTATTLLFIGVIDSGAGKRCLVTATTDKGVAVGPVLTIGATDLGTPGPPFDAVLVNQPKGSASPLSVSLRIVCIAFADLSDTRTSFLASWSSRTTTRTKWIRLSSALWMWARAKAPSTAIRSHA